VDSWLLSSARSGAASAAMRRTPLSGRRSSAAAESADHRESTEARSGALILF
jgi:hypothetical protein